MVTASHLIRRACLTELYLNIGINHPSHLENIEILIDEEILDYAIIKVNSFEAKIKAGIKNNPFVFGNYTKIHDQPSLKRTAITGFPNKLIRDKSEYPTRIYFPIYEKMPIPYKKWPREMKLEINPELFMLFDFHPSRTEKFVDKNGNTCDIFDLKGMSGGPVWILDKDTIYADKPVYGLYGVYVSTYPVNKMWKFVRIDSIIKNAYEKHNLKLF